MTDQINSVNSLVVNDGPRLVDSILRVSDGSRGSSLACVVFVNCSLISGNRAV
jgi:hypothetical protein